MVDKLSKEELEEYREAFSYFDKDRDGRITAQELPLVIRACGQAPSEKQVAALVAEIGANAKLDINEFLVVATKNLVKAPSTDAVLEAFKVFDKEGQGFIPVQEFKHSFTNLGEKLSELEAEYMIQEAGFDAENKVHFEQFVKDMSQWQ